MLPRLVAFSERIRSSLFFIPMLCVIGGILLAEVMLEVDAAVEGIDPRLIATVDSARADVTGGALTPSISILLAMVLGVASVLATVAFINHAVHSMDVSKTRDRVTQDQPTVLIYLLEVLCQVGQSLADLDRHSAVTALRRQANLIRAITEGSDVPERDRERVRAAHARYFQN